MGVMGAVMVTGILILAGGRVSERVVLVALIYAGTIAVAPRRKHHPAGRHRAVLSRLSQRQGAIPRHDREQPLRARRWLR